MKKVASATCMFLLAVAAILVAGCDGAHGHPGSGPSVVRPEEVLSFNTLYSTNCAACHGANGSGGAAIALSNPTYLALADEEVLRTVTANGVQGKLMPRFAKSVGGELTDQQIDVLVHGMLQTWGKPITATQNMPPYRTSLMGNVDRGKDEFGTYCSSCHGVNGEGSLKTAGTDKTKVGTIGSIVDEAYLDLVSDQSLRSTVIAGRPDLGMPDWRGRGTDGATPMTDQQITDILSWIASKRSTNPGQPYPVQTSPNK
jgi:cytochrome c oxidase cbb3-type subunit 3/ubiquinol-cytochrome c reductase cytochrome c subunit